VLFVPYALRDHDAYVEAMKTRGFAAGRDLVGIHREPSPREAVRKADAIYVGGGNSFRLLEALYRLDLIDEVRDRVRSGDLPYVGVSAGTNMACPTMKTTNDMPIVQPPSFNSFGLIPFQINPHYFSGPIHFETPQGLIKYAGETRDDRLREFHEMNDMPVLGLWEGTVLKFENARYHLIGQAGARWFKKGEPAVDLSPGELTDVLR
jgi:dipeptidase E